MYTISEVAKMLDISPHTLRFYDKEGLLPELAKGLNNKRYFTDRDMEWIYLIQCMRQTGMPLLDIRRYIEACGEGESTYRERHRMIKAQRERVREELKELKQRLKLLDYKEQYYKSLIRGEDMSDTVTSITDLVQELKRKKSVSLKRE